MKTKLFLQTILLFFAITVHAQITTTPTGFAVQGIARNASNKARTNANLSITFELYYIPSSSTTKTVIYTTTQSLSTDPYGVFSTVIEPGADKSTLIANKNASLKISEGAIIISDEKLQQVPYAIAASNGSPTGSIMPYVGTLAPAGWVLCDGRTLVNTPGSEDLIALVGNNAPDLRGMFLRGSGTNSNVAYSTNVGPALKAIQGDDVKPHTHSMASAGNHTHTSKFPNEIHGLNGDISHHVDTAFMKYGPINEDNQAIPEKMRDLATSSTGAHTHTIDNNTGTETRPVNYGINYIIKL